MKIVLILPSITHPRFNKRIKTLKKDFSIEIYAFDRGIYKKNIIQEDITVLGKMENKKYFSRISAYWKIFSLIRQKKGPNTVFYFFSIDTAFWGFLLLPSKSYIYEIGDFAYLGLNKIVRNLIQFIDLKMIRKSLLTVLASKGFLNYMKEKTKKISENKILVIPNKMPAEIQKYDRSIDLLNNTESLRFGFVGVLRYPKTVGRFIKIIGEKYPQHSFIFHGDGGWKSKYLELCSKYKNLEYGGAFKNPDDLEKIYNTFDIHVACYNIEGINQRLAEPNKLYESIYFGKPLIASQNSFFGEKVADLGVGFNLDARINDNIISFIDNLTLKQINQAKQAMSKIPTDKLLNTDHAITDFLKK